MNFSVHEAAPSAADQPAPILESDVSPTAPRTLKMGAFDRLYVQNPRRWAIAIVVGYVVVATLFAYYTPRWQAPDEPAHYNYIQHIATGNGLPVLQMGDYDQAQLDKLLQTNFAPKLPISGLRYESYQPPLYYLLATPVYWLGNGNLLMLRLFGVVLGALMLILLYRCLVLVFPSKTLIPLGALAFTALLPMHIAMSAAVNNDGLAELLLMAAMLVLLGWMRCRCYGHFDRVLSPEANRRQLLLLGILLGLGLLTKIYAYLLLPIVLLVVATIGWLRPHVQVATLEAINLTPSRRGLWQGLQWALWILAPACLLALPVWVRNALLYGPTDLLGLNWHDQVVIGQAQTGDWISGNGWVAYGERAFGFTFRSFWGIFGWMGVLMDERIYTALLIFTGVLFMGVLWATVRFISGGQDTDMDVFQLAVLILLGVILIAVTGGYLVYNLKFMQHQGRYFFWGLLSISTVVALGWREVLQPLQGAITGFLALVLAAATIFSGMVTGSVNKWTVLSIGSIAVILLLQPLLLAGDPEILPWLPGWFKRWLARPRVSRWAAAGRSFVWALPFILLFILDLLIPQLFIVPQLGD